MIKKMYKITSTSQSKSNNSKWIAAIADDTDVEQEESEVATFQRRQNHWRGARPETNQYQQRNNQDNTNYIAR